MLKLARRARGHFVTLIEIRVHLIRVKPGHIYVLQYISDQDKATLILGGGERAAFKRNVWISCWSTKNIALSEQVLSEIVA